MTVVSAKELKNQTGRVLRRVRQGEEVTVTVRGVPVVRLVPIRNAPARTQALQERREFVRKLAGKYKGIISVEEFLRLKEEELALEER